MSLSGSKAIMDTENVVFEDAVLERPCVYCKLLEFNDLQQGGRARVAHNGTRYVAFDTERRRNNISFWGIGFPKTEFPLGYQRDGCLPDLPALSRTASRGCAFCDMLRRDILSAWNEKIRKTFDPGLNTTGTKSAIYPKINIEEITYKFGDGIDTRPELDMLIVYFTVMRLRRVVEYNFQYNFQARSSDPSSTWFNVQRRPIPLGGFSPARYQRLNQLICHSLPEAPAPVGDIYLPTRLLDVGTKTSKTLRLVVTKQYRPLVEARDYESLRYATISYYWGSIEDAKKQVKTTRDTFKEHLRGIDEEKLPKTIADGIKVCREIGIRYIWVDALCVIQGDEEDWAKESFEMCKVFANSFITFCILRDSCTSGFLGERRAQRTLKINFRSVLDKSVSGSLYLSMSRSPRKNIRFGTSGLSTDRVAETEIRDAAWSLRGWALQEAILPSRKVFFGNVMFHMSCGNLQESEDGIPFEDWARAIFPFPARQSNMPWSSPWWNLLKEFCDRSVTSRLDTLPALSALAGTYSDCYPGQRYLAGLWESDLESGLLWIHKALEPADTYLQQRKVEYVAPSWSWACGPHAISWLSARLGSPNHFTREFQLRAAETITMESNPFGRVYGGHLLLHAKTHGLPPDRDGRLNVSRISHSNRSMSAFDFYYILQSKEGEYITHLHFDWDMHGSRHREGYPEGPIDRLWMVLISSYRLSNIDMARRTHLKDPEIMLGLVVRKADDGRGYERIGLFLSESTGLGGRNFWSGIGRQHIMLV
ncbi:HET-domain-containing protein [Rostrohypoxylon terebratum]|nr:HET-domain-containing protein [Rostrohypoxylon terebratum]